ncbi:MAG: DUF6599 family protein [Acidobacteriota bacterium]|nr:DUF6599 family protein [Acidobacteriota bacterium]
MLAAAVILIAAQNTAVPAIDDPPVSEKARLLSVLPKDGEAGEWRRHGEPQFYDGEDLFIYINGGAEIYMEYGFRAAVVQDFRSPGGRDISLELFAMDSPEAAFGMYSFKISGKGDPVGFGEGGELSSYYLNFWKGPIVATLTGFDEDPETVEGIRILAEVLDGDLPAGGVRPGLLQVLPGDEEPIRNRSYVRGPLGFANLLPLISQHLSPHHPREGVGAHYEDGSMLAVLRFASHEDAASAFEALASAVVPGGRLHNFRNKGDSFIQMSTDRGREIASAVKHDKMILAETADSDSGSAIVNKTLERLVLLDAAR